jgi:hypothetical protein
MSDEYKASKRKILRAHYRRLAKLEEQKALHGYSRDPKLDLEIEDIKKEIEDIEDEIEKIKKPVYVRRPIIIEYPNNDLPKLMVLLMTSVVALALVYYFYVWIPRLYIAKISPTRSVESSYQSWDSNGFVLSFNSEHVKSNEPSVDWIISNNTYQDISIPNTFYEGFYAKDDLGNSLKMATIGCFENDKWIDCVNTLHPKQSIGIVQSISLANSNPNPKEIVFTVLDIPKAYQNTFHIPVK